ncbi:MAG: hypothetical protein HRT89_13340 [Lentisphaeria bacterium]|nr:hypothetical protein [Lentisphaeria bacterium]NQZ69041.1 hypothetical protein [Lentisphaeria bacterium]
MSDKIYEITCKNCNGWVEVTPDHIAKLVSCPSCNNGIIVKDFLTGQPINISPELRSRYRITEEELIEYIEQENDELYDIVMDIDKDPNLCWDYAVYAAILEERILEHLPETSSSSDVKSPMFVNKEKVRQEILTAMANFLEILHDIGDTFGSRFYNALIAHDSNTIIDSFDKLSDKLNKVCQNRIEIEAIVMPKKEPYSTLRFHMLQLQNDMHFRFNDLIFYLVNRSHKTVDSNQYGTVHVTLAPQSLHKIQILLNQI